MVKIATIEGATLVRDYLNSCSTRWNQWRLTNSDDSATLQNTKRELCEVKEITDACWNVISEQKWFIFHYYKNDKKAFRRDIMHNAKYCIVINTSHTKIAWLDFTTLEYDEVDRWFWIKAVEVVELGGNK